MKKYFIIIVLIIGTAITAVADTTTYSVPNSPFLLTKQITQTVEGWGENVTVITAYQYFLDVKPAAAHSNLQRIEYVGFRVVYQNGFKFYQLFPNGSIQELTDINQSLYAPSYYAVNPASIGRYQLFPAPISSDLPGVTTSACLENVFPATNAGSVLGVNIMAGYGFLTQANVNLINQQKAIEANPIILNQPGFKPLDIQTLQLALAQGNMFQNTAYYNIFDITNNCPIVQNNGGWGGGY